MQPSQNRASRTFMDFDSISQSMDGKYTILDNISMCLLETAYNFTSSIYFRSNTKKKNCFPKFFNLKIVTIFVFIYYSRSNLVTRTVEFLFIKMLKGTICFLWLSRCEAMQPKTCFLMLCRFMSSNTLLHCASLSSSKIFVYFPIPRTSTRCFLYNQ